FLLKTLGHGKTLVLPHDPFFHPRTFRPPAASSRSPARSLPGPGILAGPFRVDRIHRPRRLRGSPHRRRMVSTSRRPHRRCPFPRYLLRTSSRVLPIRRLRHRALPTSLPGNRRALAGVAPEPARSPIFLHLALAPAPSLSSLRNLPRSLALVRSPPSLRQHRRIPRPDPLLFLTLHDPGQRRLAHRA